MYKNNLQLLVILLISIFFTACGSGGSSANITGQFIDAPVEGLSYKCSSGQEGTTDKDGKYTCNEGDTVEFSVNGIVLGSYKAQDIITPLHLHESKDRNKVNNIVQLLHSLDKDQDPDNNIVIDETITLEGLDLSAEASDFANNLTTKFTNFSKPIYNRNKSQAKMLHYIKNNSKGSNYGLSIDIETELSNLELLMCKKNQKLLNASCVADIELAENKTEYKVYEIMQITTNGITLPETLEATIDKEQTVTLSKLDENTLTLLIPKLTEGSHTIDISIDDSSRELTFSTLKYEEIKDAKTNVDSYVTSLNNDLEKLINDTSDSSEKAHFQKIFDDLQKNHEQITEEDYQILAQIFSNYNIGNLSTISKRNTALCTDTDLVIYAKRSFAGLNLTILGGLSSSTGLGAIIGVAGAAIFTSNMMDLIECNIYLRVKQILHGTILELDSYKISKDIKSNSSVSINFEYDKKKEMPFILKSSPLDSIKPELQKFTNMVLSNTSIIPDFIIEKTRNLLKVQKEDIDSNSLSIENISDSNIIPKYVAKGSALEVSFSLNDENLCTGENTSFTFDVKHSNSNEELTKGKDTVSINATLACPSYEWETSDWGKCEGECEKKTGIQTREVVCKNSTGDTVDNTYCDISEKPENTQSCTLKCNYTPITPCLTCKENVIPLTLSEDSEEAVGWTIGNFTTYYNERKHPNTVYLYMREFEGPNKEEPFTFQDSNITLSFFDENYELVTSLTTSSFSFYIRYFDMKRAETIKYYRLVYSK